MTTTRITLSTDERFTIWGQTVASLKVQTASVAWGDDVSLRNTRGEFIGTVKPSQVPQVANALLTRQRLA